MRPSILISILALCTTSAVAQVDEEVIKKQAELTAEALITDDYETLIRFTHPRVIELLGGKEKMISLIRRGKVEFSQQGITFDKVVIGRPSKTVLAGDEIHCLIPQTTYMKGPNGTVKSDTHLLAITRDNGVNWYFIDAVSLNKDNIAGILPNFNFALELPAKKKPVFIQD